MLAWLIALIAALAGLLYLLDIYSNVINAVPPVVVAGAVIAALIAVYGLLSRSQINTDRSRISRWMVAGIVLFAAAAALRYAGTLQGLREPVTAGAPSGDLASIPGGPAAVRIRKRDDGIFVARGALNGSPAEFIIDSGAATVMLRPTDAERAGIDLSRLTFDTPIETAGGATYVAPVRLRSVAVGPIVFDDVEAFVARPGSLNENLLGQDFLRRLASYDVSGDFMTLRK